MTVIFVFGGLLAILTYILYTVITVILALDLPRSWEKKRKPNLNLYVRAS